MLKTAVVCFLLLFLTPDLRSSDPVEITDEGLKSSPTAASGTAISLKIVNKSGQAIAALVTVVSFSDREGKLHSQASKTIVRGLVPSGTRSFAPNETMLQEFDPVLTADGQPLAYKVSADYVLFSDKSLQPWGPDRTKESLKIAGLRLAHRMERSRLRLILEQRGVNAVIDDLRQN